MPTRTYGLEARCLNCGQIDIVTIPRGSRWVNSSVNHIGSCYYKKNDPSKRIKKRCTHCGCDALKKQGIITQEEMEAMINEQA